MEQSQNSAWRKRPRNLCVDLGIFGLVFFFLVLVPFAVFEAYFWSGMGFRHAPIPTPEVRLAAFWNAFLWVVVHQLWCFFVVPAMLLWYGRRKARSAVETIGAKGSTP
jgi:hypothetical protein